MKEQLKIDFNKIQEVSNFSNKDIEINKLEQMKPDIAVVSAYGQILSSKLLSVIQSCPNPSLKLINNDIKKTIFFILTYFSYSFVSRTISHLSYQACL